MLYASLIFQVVCLAWVVKASGDNGVPADDDTLETKNTTKTLRACNYEEDLEI